MCMSCEGVETVTQVRAAGGYVVNIGGVWRVTTAAGAGAGVNLKVMLAVFMGYEVKLNDELAGASIPGSLADVW